MLWRLAGGVTGTARGGRGAAGSGVAGTVGAHVVAAWELSEAVIGGVVGLHAGGVERGTRGEVARGLAGVGGGSRGLAGEMRAGVGGRVDRAGVGGGSRGPIGAGRGGRIGSRARGDPDGWYEVGARDTGWMRLGSSVARGGAEERG
nr:glycine-rich cell wall structural protein-like [Aegilops tauschii subsp. strangulata]